MKRISALLLILAVLLTNQNFVYASDYEEHWAEQAIFELMELNIISGYEDGTVRPDKKLTRAEFVKIVNSVFGFTQEAEVNFEDVTEGVWYYNEFLKAKHAGIIMGNEANCANPEKEITRAEACAVISRALGFDASDVTDKFADSSTFPSWAEGHINAMKANALISGYEDGSFKCDNSISRGESFSIINNVRKFNASRNENTEIEEKNEPENIVKNPVVSIGDSTGGGGGGGTSPSVTVKYADIPSIVQCNNGILEWAEATGAAAYEVKVKLDDNEEIISDIRDTKIDLNTLFSTMSNEGSDPTAATAVFSLFIKSIGAVGYNDSVYCAELQLPVPFESVEKPQLVARYGTANKIRRAIVSWPEVEDAVSYTIKLTNNGAETESYVYREDKREILIADMSESETAFKLSVTAISGNSSKKNSVTAELELKYKASAEVVQDGTKEHPYLIYTDEDFRQISDMTAHYEIRNDITVTAPLGSESAKFTGTIKGNLNNSGYKPIVTLNINSTSNHTGFIGYANGATIENLEFAGSVSSTGTHTGSVVGYGLTTEIKNCINNAVINGDENLVLNSYSGGIAGLIGTSSKINNCINTASVSGKQYTGGIVGYINGTSTVEGCINSGAITATSNYTGGISGRANTSEILKCENKGIISGKTETGGINGYIYGDACTVKECFNRGAVSGGEHTGGIQGRFYGGNGASVTISNCFNTGVISSASSVKGTIMGTAGHKNYTNIASVSNCYDSSNDGMDLIGSNNVGDSGITNCYISTDALTDILTNNTAYTSDIWVLKEDFAYPQLVNNPYTKAAEFKPVIKNLSAILDAVGTLTFEWENPENVQNIKIRINNNSEIKEVMPLTDFSSDTTSVSSSGAVSGEYYQFEITYEFADENVSNITYSYEIKAE